MDAAVKTEKTEESEYVIINGDVYIVIDDHGDWLTVRRPNGAKAYAAERLPDSPLYGEGRARKAPWRG